MPYPSERSESEVLSCMILKFKLRVFSYMGIDGNHNEPIAKIKKEYHKIEKFCPGSCTWLGSADGNMLTCKAINLGLSPGLGNNFPFTC